MDTEWIWKKRAQFTAVILRRNIEEFKRGNWEERSFKKSIRIRVQSQGWKIEN